MPDVQTRQALDLPRHSTIAASATTKFCRALAAVGVDPVPMLARLELPISPDPDARISYALYCRLAHEVAESLGRPTIGLDMAQGARLADLDVLGEVIRFASSGRDALQRLQRYYVILSQANRFVVQEDATSVTTVYETPGVPPSLQRYDDDFTLATMVLVSRELTGEPWTPLRVTFTQPAPDDLEPYLRVFGQAPVFGAPQTSIAFPRELLDRRFPAPVSRMERIVLDTAEALLNRQEETTPERVRAAVVACLPSGAVTVGQVADRLMVSVRTLQRELGRTGTTFRTLVDEVRATEARRLLLQSERTQAEIAFLLGFSEQSAFVRAFRRWHGAPPSKFRSSQS